MSQIIKEVIELHYRVLNRMSSLPKTDPMTDAMKKYTFSFNDAVMLVGDIFDNQAEAKAKYTGPDLEIVDMFGNYADDSDTKMTKLQVLKKRVQDLERIKF